jgi:predicted nucleic acid-binding protein
MGGTPKQAILTMGYLLDTNVVINYLNASLPVAGMQFLDAIVDDEPIISLITKMETLGFNFKSAEEQAITETFANGCSILDLNENIVNTTIGIRKNKKMKLPDAIIAATALVYDLTLITRNTSDFKNMEGLKVINPFDLS